MKLSGSQDMGALENLVADNHNPINDPYQTLWVNVIVRAINDACGLNMSCSGADNKNYWIRTAKYFLFEDTESLAAICNELNLEVEWVRKVARERIKSGRTNIFRTRPITRTKRRYFVGQTEDKLARKKQKESL